MRVVTFTELRNHLKEIMDTSGDQHELVVIKRSRQEDMVLLPLSNYESLKETAYLLSDEANAQHLRQSIRSLQQGDVLNKKLIEE